MLTTACQAAQNLSQGKTDAAQHSEQLLKSN